jgi:hypothetical protein
VPARQRPDRSAGAEPGGHLDSRPRLRLALGVLLADVLGAVAELLVRRDAGLDVDAVDVAGTHRQQRGVVLLGVGGHLGDHERPADRADVGRAGGGPLDHQLPLDLARTGERGGVGGRLRARAQDRGLADLEHQDADRQQGEHDHQQARQDLSAFPLAHARHRR